MRSRSEARSDSGRKPVGTWIGSLDQQQPAHPILRSPRINSL
jgi:hypothetical protein